MIKRPETRSEAMPDYRRARVLGRGMYGFTPVARIDYGPNAEFEFRLRALGGIPFHRTSTAVRYSLVVRGVEKLIFIQCDRALNEFGRYETDRMICGLEEAASGDRDEE